MSKNVYDIAVIGGGPGGMNAVIYAARMGLSVAIIESYMFGGQMLNTEEIDNYIGAPFTKGSVLSQDMEDQMTAIIQDEEHIYYEEVSGINKLSDGTFEVTLEDEDETILAKNVIIATGASNRKLDIENSIELGGRGISYCAVCDGAFFRNEDVVIIGGGNSAIEEAYYMSKVAKSVKVIHRRNEFRADFVELEKLKELENVELVTPYIPTRFIEKDGVLGGVEVKNVETEEVSILDVTGAFVQIGQYPNISFIDDSLGIDFDEQGFIITDEKMRTSVQGIYAIGDVRSKDLRQIVTSVSDGSIASKTIQESL